MAAGPGDETGKTEQVIEALKAAFVQGRLAKDEFDSRVGAALAAYAELHALTADIPAAAPAVPSPGPAATPSDEKRPQVSREAYNKGLIARGAIGGAGGGMLVATIAVTVATGNPFVGFMVGGMLGAFMAVILGTLMTLILWALESSDGRPSRPPRPPQPPQTREVRPDLLAQPRARAAGSSRDGVHRRDRGRRSPAAHRQDLSRRLPVPGL